MKARSMIFVVIILCSAAMGQQDNTPRYWIEKGRTFFNASISPEKNFPEAQSCFDKAIELMQSCAEGKCDSASCDKAACAEAWYRKGLCLADPRSEAQITNYEYQYGEAEKYFDKALLINPNYAEALSLKGFCRIQLGYPEEALPILDRALEMDPTFDDAWDMKGYALYELGHSRYAEALDCFKKAAEYNPNWSDPWSNMAVIYHDIGDSAKEKECNEKVTMLGDLGRSY